MSTPKRGEIWLVDLNPTKGQEIQKTRPVVVISSDVYQLIALKELLAGLVICVEYESDA